MLPGFSIGVRASIPSSHRHRRLVTWLGLELLRYATRDASTTAAQWRRLIRIVVAAGVDYK